MRPAVFDTANARPWFTCPVHGFHGRDRCPTCQVEQEAQLATISAPLVMPRQAADLRGITSGASGLSVGLLAPGGGAEALA